jgi:hypothetical protein
MTSTDSTWLAMQFRSGIPPDRIKSVVEWAEKNVRLIGSARSEQFVSEISPWTREPIECAGNGCRKVTLIKPIQTGGSVVGEIALLFWLSTWPSVDVCYYWPNDLAADARWSKRFQKILLACAPLMARTSDNRFDWSKGQDIFPSQNLIMQGVRTDRSVASDSFRGICCEELHDVEGGWIPGRLEQVYGRQGAHWSAVCFNVSNAGFVNSDLHKAFLAGTQQHWEVKCPGCGQYHVMRCQWKADEPHLGGLHYDATDCRLGNFVYDYNKLAPTIRYIMPCGYQMRDEIVPRRALSESGRYSEPRPGSLLTERSYTYEMVSCDWIPWIEIIKRKHAALKAMATGDYQPYFDYLREVECHFVDIGRDRPAPERVHIITSEKKKNREGLPNRVFRVAGIDRQKGKTSQGDVPHFWLFVQDWDANANSQVVWEGRCDTEGELVATLRDLQVTALSVVADSSWDSVYMYDLCLRHGWNCIKVDEKNEWRWEDGVTRFYSEPRPLIMIANRPPSQADPALEPMFWQLGKYSAMERLVYLRQAKSVKYEIPSDVSDDFIQQFDSWSLEVEHKKDGQLVNKWKQLRDDDHLYQCAAYVLSLIDLADGFVNAGVTLTTETGEVNLIAAANPKPIVPAAPRTLFVGQEI